jgi:glycosyltransferase involved in cell wall biosynthesis
VNRDRIKIVYTLAWMEVGGSQTHLLQVLRLLDPARFEPVLYCLTGQGALLPLARETGVRVVDGGMRSGFRPAAMLRGIAHLARFLRRERADVVHNYLLRANVVGSVAARLARVPVVLVSKRGCHERRGMELAGARLSNRLADCVTANAEAVRDFVHQNESCPREKFAVIPSGIDTDRFRPLPPGDYKRRLGLDPRAPVVGAVTRMRVRKGVEEFLRAMAEVRRAYPEVQTVVAGEVDREPALDALVAECGLGESLHLLGRRRDMPEVLSAFDVFVLSSHDEGMSNAILEAMAMQLPVVATGVGGTGEVVRHGESGLLVPPRDPAPLAAAIASLLPAPERRAAMGRVGREIVERSLSARSMVRQMEALYDRLLRGRGQDRLAAAGVRRRGEGEARCS